MLQNQSRHSARLPAISTASLPDIVFILLFFFMTVTTIENQNIKVAQQLPKAFEVERLNYSDRTIDIFVGYLKQPSNLSPEGTIGIQLEDGLVEIGELGHRALTTLHSMPEHLRQNAMVSIKADKRVQMGIIQDIKAQLRKVNILKINYIVVSGVAKNVAQVNTRP